MIQAIGDVRIQRLTDLCDDIVKEVCIPEDWKSSVVLPIYKGKGDPMECGSYRGIKLLQHAMKVVKKSLNIKIEMWANAQRDGRPAEYRWHPLFNAAVWLTPTTRCCAVTLPRSETS